MTQQNKKMLKWKKLILLLIVVAFLVPQISSASTLDTLLTAANTIMPDSFSGFGMNITRTSGGAYGGGSYYGGGYGSGSGGWSVGNVSGFGLPQGSVAGIISGLLSWLLAIFGFIGIIGFVIAGIMYVLAAGNDTMLEKAKTAMTWSAVGIVVGLIGFVIIQAIDAALNMGSNF